MQRTATGRESSVRALRMEPLSLPRPFVFCPRPCVQAPYRCCTKHTCLLTSLTVGCPGLIDRFVSWSCLLVFTLELREPTW